MRAADVEAGYVVRMPKAYPVYDEDYRANVDVLRGLARRSTPPTCTRWGATACTSTTTRTTRCSPRMLTVENILGASHDIWEVNVEEEYHEEGGAASGRQGHRPRRTHPPEAVLLAADGAARGRGWPTT